MHPGNMPRPFDPEFCDETPEANELSRLRERVRELEGLVRQLAEKFKQSEPPRGLISAVADTYPYVKGEILEKAERVLNGLPPPTTGNCGHCAQPYASADRVRELEATVIFLGGEYNKFWDRAEAAEAKLEEAIIATYKTGYDRGHNQTIEGTIESDNAHDAALQYLSDMRLMKAQQEKDDE